MATATTTTNNSAYQQLKIEHRQVFEYIVNMAEAMTRLQQPSVSCLNWHFYIGSQYGATSRKHFYLAVNVALNSIERNERIEALMQKSLLPFILLLSGHLLISQVVVVYGLNKSYRAQTTNYNERHRNETIRSHICIYDLEWEYWRWNMIDNTHTHTLSHYIQN